MYFKEFFLKWITCFICGIINFVKLKIVALLKINKNTKKINQYFGQKNIMSNIFGIPQALVYQVSI